MSKVSCFLLYLGVLISCSQLPSGAQKPRPKSHLYRIYLTDTGPGENEIGFINNMGKVVLGFDRLPTGSEVDDFSEGLAAIRFLDPRLRIRPSVGFIDATGGIVIAPRFRSTSRFSEGLAYVETDDTKGFINRCGDFVIQLKDAEHFVYDFHEGFAVIATAQGEGFIDRTGKLVISGYKSAESFSEGMAAVSVDHKQLAQYGFINREGKIVIPERFQRRIEGGPDSFVTVDAIQFSGGLARVRTGGLYGYIDKKGVFVIPPRFLYAGDFSEGLASAVEKNKAGFIDKAGHWVITLKIALESRSVFNAFKNGLAPVAIKTEHGIRWGYIDRSGKMAIPAVYLEAFPFDDGVALVYVYDATGKLAVGRYIDTTGRYLWQPEQAP